MRDTEDEDLDEVLNRFQRKHRRKPRRQIQEGGEEAPIIRGLWVQEIDWLKSTDRELTSSTEIIPPPPQFTDSASHPCSCGELQSCVCDGCSCAHVCECVTALEAMSQSEDEDRSVDLDDTSSTDDRGSDSDGDLEQDSESICTHEIGSDSSCGDEDNIRAHGSLGAGARVSNLTFDLMHVSGFHSSSHAEWDSDSTGCGQSLLGISDATHSCSTVNTPQHAFGFDDLSDPNRVWDVLRGRVAQMPKQSVSPLFKDLIKQTLNDWKSSKSLNEGLIFHHVRHLHPVNMHHFVLPP